MTTDTTRQLADRLRRSTTALAIAVDVEVYRHHSEIAFAAADEIDRLRTAVNWCIGAWITPGVGVSCQDLKNILTTQEDL